MRRQEFIENIQDFYQLKEFCYDENVDIGTIFPRDDLNEHVLEEIEGMDDFIAIREYLYTINEDYDWYEDLGWGELRGIGDREFEIFKERVITYMDDEGYWEDEDEWLEELDEDTLDDEDISDEAFNTLFLAV